MRRLAQLAALAAAAVLAQAANAGRLLSATFQQQLLFGTPIISVTSTSATGSFTGTSFRLDAGSWFATSGCLGPRAGCAPATLPSLLSRVTFRIDARSNAQVEGAIGQSRITARPGIAGIAFLFDRGGATRDATFWSAGADTLLSYNVKYVEAAPWVLGATTQRGLTILGSSIADAMATGGVSVTAQGNTHIQLVSFTRIHDYGLSSGAVSTTTRLSRLSLVFLPEPATGALLGAGAVLLAALGMRRR